MTEVDSRNSAGLWPDLVSIALVGTQRRSAANVPVPEAVTPFVPPALHGAGEVLLASGALTLARRAGTPSLHGLVPPSPAVVDPRPLPPDAASQTLGGLVANNATDFMELWLRIAVERGVRTPDAMAVDLLRIGSRHERLRPMIAAVTGPRGAWLGVQRDEWRWALTVGKVAEAAEADEASERSDDETPWSYGGLQERVTFLASLRRRDRGRAHELLAQGWTSEPPAERAAFIAVIGEGLGLDDEDLLEAALDDRRKEVRDAAAALLAVLDGSAYQERMAQRARAYVTLGRRELAVEPPATCDKAAKRDGIVAKPPSGVGERTWWLLQIVQAAPLSAWVAFGDPSSVVALPVADDWRPWLHRGWAQAAVRTNNILWADALLSAGFGTASAEDRGIAAQLLLVLPPERAGNHLLRIISDGPTDTSLALAVLAGCPNPLPDAYTEILLGYLRTVLQAYLSATYLPSDIRATATAIVDRLPPQAAPRVETLRSILLEQRSDDGATQVPNLLNSLCYIANNRYKILQEFA